MVLVFLHGWPGVGKLTVGEELASRTGYRLFHNHLTVDLASAVFEFGSPAFVDLREHIWLDVFRRAAEEEVSLVFTFAAERTVGETFVGRARDAVERAGGELVFVELRCEPEALARRVESPGRRRFGKLASAESLRALAREGVLFDLDVPADARSLRVETTALSPAETAEEIIEGLNLGRLE
jgi:broad-specificity NMP kinase